MTNRQRKQKFYKTPIEKQGREFSGFREQYARRMKVFSLLKSLYKLCEWMEKKSKQQKKYIYFPVITRPKARSFGCFVDKLR